MAVNRIKTHAWPAALLLVWCSAACGGDGINLSVTNDGITDIYVTVYDISAKPKVMVLSHQRINGFTSVPISVGADGDGLANVSWTAVGVDTSDPHCGHGARKGLSADANVNVHADSACGS